MMAYSFRSVSVSMPCHSPLMTKTTSNGIAARSHTPMRQGGTGLSVGKSALGGRIMPASVPHLRAGH